MNDRLTTRTTAIAPAKRESGSQSFELPAIIAEAGPSAAERFLEFFTANIRNANTRRAYVCFR